jgi:hypothetical protein
MSDYDVSAYTDGHIGYVLTTTDDKQLTDETVDKEQAAGTIDAILAYNTNEPDGNVFFHPGEDGDVAYLQTVAAHKDAVLIGKESSEIGAMSRRTIKHVEDMHDPESIYDHLTKRAVNAARTCDE